MHFTHHPHETTHNGHIEHIHNHHMVQTVANQHHRFSDQNYARAVKYEPMDQPICDQQVKYEPVEGSPVAVLDYASAMAAGHVAAHPSTSPYSNCTPASSFHDSPELAAAAARMNGVIQSVSQGGGSEPHTMGCYSSSEEPASVSPNAPVVPMDQSMLKTADGRQVRGRPNNDRKRPYPCKMCPSKFGSKMELEEHQNSHTGQKPFECEKCMSRFNRRSTLWNHKRIHSDTKPFVCTVCNMKFKWKNSLKCHKEMHIRKNETNDTTDTDIRQLTYATAAKKRLLEMEGADTTNLSSLTIFSASAPSTSGYNGGPDQAKLNKKKTRASKKVNEPHGEGPQVSQEAEAPVQTQLFDGSFLNLNQSGNLSMDLTLDGSNLDFMNMNNSLLMEALLNNTDFTLDPNNKDMLSPLTAPIQSINVPLPFIKNYANVDLNHLSSTLNHDLMRPHDPLPTMNHFNPSINVNDPYNQDILPGNYIASGSNPSSSSTPSSMSHNTTIHGIMPELSYATHDSLLLNHPNDYNMNHGFGWATPASSSYPQHSTDMPLSALGPTDSIDPCLVHHPGCLSSHMPGMH